MARNDGKNYSVARNAQYTRSHVGNMERHNERKNEVYQNKDIDLSRSELNIVFKKSDDGYLSTFDKMCEDGTITTKGLRANATIIDEMLCDVNSSYFEMNGGYDFAKEFFIKAYEFAVNEIGGEEYILSAVMHADERNAALSEKLGKDVYHYHLHVVYVPVVQKEVKWSKRCKDKSLIGTVKEVITQVSHSKKWASKKVVGEDGSTHLEKSYSLLQDRYFSFMQQCGYTDIERGEKGSTEQNLSVTEFKVHQEELRLQENMQKVSKSKSELEKVVKKKANIKAIDTIETKPAMIDKSKIVVDKTEFDDIKILAQKQIAGEKKERKLLQANERLTQENQTLKRENLAQKNELSQFKSITNRLKEEQQKIKLQELEKFQDIVMKFLDKTGLRSAFEQFRKSFSRQRNEVDR